MSVFGIDFGSSKFVVSLARRRGVDIVLNEASRRMTPTLISFVDDERLLGEAASHSRFSNWKTTLECPRNMLGLKYFQQNAKLEMDRLNQNTKKLPDGEIGIELMHRGEMKTFTPVQLASMLIAKMAHLCAKEEKSMIRDCVITVPSFFTEPQRRAILDAARIAGVNCLRLMNETAAAALTYGIRGAHLPEKKDKPLIIALCDVGYSQTTVSIVAFKKGELKVLGSAFDRHLGGRDFDAFMVQQCVDEFKKKRGVDLSESPKSILRLGAAAEKAKKILSSIAQADLHVEYVYEDYDFSTVFKREHLVELWAPLIARIGDVCAKAIADARVLAKDVSNVEILGGCTRVPAVQAQILRAFNKNQLSRTLNADECIAFGAALMGAIVSPSFKVKDFAVNDFTSYPITISWFKNALEKGEELDSMVLFKKNNTVPSAKLVTFYRAIDFDVWAYYTDCENLPDDEPRDLGIVTVKGRPATIPVVEEEGKDASAPPQVKVRIKLNANGLLELGGAQMIEDTLVEVEEKEEPKKKEEKKKKEDKEAAPMDEEEAKKGADTAAAAPAEKMDSEEGPPPLETPGAGDGSAAPEKGDSAAEPKVEEPAAKKKEPKFVKKVIKTDLGFLTKYYSGLDETPIREFAGAETEMAKQDAVIKEVRDKRNVLESYVYDTRSKLGMELKDFVEEKARTEFLQILDTTETWLYEDGFDADLNTLIKKITELKCIGDPIYERYMQSQLRPRALIETQQACEWWIKWTENKEEKFAHISGDDRKKMVKQVMECLQWLGKTKEQADKAKKSADPKVTADQIYAKRDALNASLKEIANKPKPEPKKEEKKDEKKEDKKEGKKEDKKEDKKEKEKEEKKKGEKEEEEAAPMQDATIEGTAEAAQDEAGLKEDAPMQTE